MRALEYVGYKEYWKAAIVKMREDGLTYGDIITHEEMYNLIGVPMPEKLTGFRDIKQAQLAYIHNVEKIRRELLEEDQMDMQNVRGIGYQIVNPNEQTSKAMGDMMADIKRVLRRTAGRIGFVDLARLSAEEQRENTDARARLSFFRKSVRQGLPE